MKINGRFPLAYIMEAADDISYCLSDIEDGVEKQIITSPYFFDKLYEECKIVFGKDNDIPFNELIIDKKTKSDFFALKISVIRWLILHVISRYFNKHKDIIEGTLSELIDKDSCEGKFLKCIKIYLENTYISLERG
ncbi:MAG: hypothetical protein IPI46_14250 [Bacteroidetes bacterium]|nr:hypothetical protein [Bacteroidota bacterium]